jgi:pyruvate/2-oxoglutarate dehydrogenase complex dihydrolipoamide dehydrogenase (E3) component
MSGSADVTHDSLDEADRRLRSHVRPAGWVNPMPSGKYNLVVLGAGTAGLVSAAGGAGLGAKVALVEKHVLGGDCLNVGCVPSKALLRPAKLLGEIAAAHEMGIGVGSVQVDFRRVMQRLRDLRADISVNDSVARFTKLGVDVYLGPARFVSPNEVDVDGRRLVFSKGIIATGARAVIPAIAGLAEAGPLTNETVFQLTELPARLAVLGGGPIGAELSQAFARLGSKVTLIERSGHILPREEREAAQLVQQSLMRSGVDIRLQSALERVDASANPSSMAKRLTIRRKGSSNEDSVEVIEVDAILVGAGRAANVDGLGLEEAGIKYSADGVWVDDFLRTSHPRVFAAGDIASKYKFTHAADALARIALRNALFLGRARASRLLVPWCTYTDPELAHVGLGPREAEEQGIKIQTFDQRFADLDRAILDGETEGLVRIHTRAGSDEIVGGTIVARHAGDMIGEITLAMHAKVGLGRLASVIHPYPTQAESIRKLGDAYNRTRLTPWVAGLFRRWLAWNR